MYDFIWIIISLTFGFYTNSILLCINETDYILPTFVTLLVFSIITPFVDDDFNKEEQYEILMFDY